MTHIPIFHVSDAKGRLSFGKRDNKSFQASAVALKTLHMPDHLGTIVQIFGACLVSFSCPSTYPSSPKMDMSRISQDELTSYLTLINTPFGLQCQRERCTGEMLRMSYEG